MKNIERKRRRLFSRSTWYKRKGKLLLFKFATLYPDEYPSTAHEIQTIKQGLDEHVCC